MVILKERHLEPTRIDRKDRRARGVLKEHNNFGLLDKAGIQIGDNRCE
jgi:hypothetical protein